MEETKVSFEVAKLLKDIGFDGNSYDVFTHNGNLWSDGWIHHLDDNRVKPPFNSSDIRDNEILRPTLSLAQKWFREIHNIQIDILEYYKEDDLPLSNLKFPKPEGFFVWEKYNDNFNEDEAMKFQTYEEALEEGLKQAYLIVKKKLNEK